MHQTSLDLQQNQALSISHAADSESCIVSLALDVQLEVSYLDSLSNAVAA